MFPMEDNNATQGQILADYGQYQHKNSNKVIGRPFKKGQSGNPKGKPVGTKSYTTLVRRALKNMKDWNGNPLTIEDIFSGYIENTIRGMQKGDPKYFRAYTDLLNRMYGKPAIRKEVEAKKEVPVITGVRIVLEK